MARIRSEARGLGAGCLCLMATNGLALAIPWLLKGAIDVLGHANGAAGAAAARHLVVRNALLIAGFAVLQAVIRTWSRIFIFNAGRNLEYTLRRDVFAHLLRMDQGFYRAHPTGDLMSRLTNDLSAVRMLFGPGLLNLVNTVLVYVSSLWLLFGLSPRLTLFALIPYPALILGGRAFSHADVPGQPPAAGPAGAAVDGGAGGPGGRRGDQAVRPGAAAPRGVRAAQRRVPGQVAAPGSRARNADAAVRR